MNYKTIPIDPSYDGKPRELELHYHGEAAGITDRDTQPVGNEIYLHSVWYKGRDVLRWLTKQTIEEIETLLYESFDGFERDYYDHD